MVDIWLRVCHTFPCFSFPFNLCFALWLTLTPSLPPSLPHSLTHSLTHYSTLNHSHFKVNHQPSWSRTRTRTRTRNHRPSTPPRLPGSSSYDKKSMGLQTLPIVLICLCAAIILIGLAALVGIAMRKNGRSIPSGGYGGYGGED